MVAGVMGHGGLIGAGGPVDRGVIVASERGAQGLLGESFLPEDHLKAVKGGFEGDTSLLPCASAGTFSS